MAASAPDGIYRDPHGASAVLVAFSPEHRVQTAHPRHAAVHSPAAGCLAPWWARQIPAARALAGFPAPPGGCPAATWCDEGAHATEGAPETGDDRDRKRRRAASPRARSGARTLRGCVRTCDRRRGADSAASRKRGAPRMSHGPLTLVERGIILRAVLQHGARRRPPRYYS